MNTALAIEILLAAAFSASLYIVLRYFSEWRVNNLHGLTANYLTAALLAFVWNFSGNVDALSDSTWKLPYAAGIGVLFISVFYVAALTTQKAGITVTSIAGKMSMIIPIGVGILVFDDQLTPLRLTGMLVALAAVLLSTYTRKNGAETNRHMDTLTILLPVLLFIGSGMVDTSIKLSQHFLMEDESDLFFTSMLFGFAGIIGSILSLKNFFSTKTLPKSRSIAAGVLLGILNFFSLLFLINALASPGAESSVIFSLTNVLVVLFSTASGMFLFSEKINRTKAAGILLAIISIVILSR
jgi:drug/metabolite transporter (DMT)-like permease